MTNNLRDEIARRQKVCEAAPKAPWVIAPTEEGRGAVCSTGAFCDVFYYGGYKQPSATTANFAAHARTGYPEVLAALADAVAALEKLSGGANSSKRHENVASAALEQIAGRLESK